MFNLLTGANSVTTIFRFSSTGRHETIRIADGDSEFIEHFIGYECHIYILYGLKTETCIYFPLLISDLYIVSN